MQAILFLLLFFPIMSLASEIRFPFPNRAMLESILLDIESDHSASDQAANKAIIDEDENRLNEVFRPKSEKKKRFIDEDTVLRLGLRRTRGSFLDDTNAFVRLDFRGIYDQNRDPSEFYLLIRAEAAEGGSGVGDQYSRLEVIPYQMIDGHLEDEEVSAEHYGRVQIKRDFFQGKDVEFKGYFMGVSTVKRILGDDFDCPHLALVVQSDWFGYRRVDYASEANAKDDYSGFELFQARLGFQGQMLENTLPFLIDGVETHFSCTAGGSGGSNFSGDMYSERDLKGRVQFRKNRYLFSAEYGHFYQGDTGAGIHEDQGVLMFILDIGLWHGFARRPFVRDIGN